MTDDQKKIAYSVVFAIGIMAVIWEIELYRHTVINPIIPIAIIILTGGTITPLVMKDFERLFDYRSRFMLIVWSFVQSSVSWGFIACTFFMAVNFYGPTSEAKRQTFSIVERSSLAGRKYHRDERKPTFKIEYEGKLKELVFSNAIYPDMDTYRQIEVSVKKGFLGYDLLVNPALK